MSDIPLRIYKNMTYRNQHIKIDGVRFEDCEFIDCHFVYSGGEAEAINCKIHPDTVWEMQGPAGAMMRVLAGYGWRISFGNGSPEDVVRFPDEIQ